MFRIAGSAGARIVVGLEIAVYVTSYLGKDIGLPHSIKAA